MFFADFLDNRRLHTVAGDPFLEKILAALSRLFIAIFFQLPAYFQN
jgi:hypothetical protein